VRDPRAPWPRQIRDRYDVPARYRCALRRAAQDQRAGAYHAELAKLSHADLRALGEDYLARTRIHRKLGRPFFIDKMPNNFAHVGLIHLILPNAKIVDVRRHPLACCFSGFKQHFARGQSFTYGLENIGRYYRDYVELMDHFDTALPGRVHRVIYEDLFVRPIPLWKAESDAPETERRPRQDYEEKYASLFWGHGN
jgi:hypothetical protein